MSDARAYTSVVCWIFLFAETILSFVWKFLKKLLFFHFQIFFMTENSIMTENQIWSMIEKTQNFRNGENPSEKKFGNSSLLVSWPDDLCFFIGHPKLTRTVCLYLIFNQIKSFNWKTMTFFVFVNFLVCMKFLRKDIFWQSFSEHQVKAFICCCKIVVISGNLRHDTRMIKNTAWTHVIEST